jgi:hypothetical protein
MAIPVAVISGAVTLIGRYLQISAAKDSARAQAHANRLAAATVVLSEVSEILNGLVYFAQQAMWGSVLTRDPANVHVLEEDEQVWRTYSDMVAKWEQTRIIALSRLTTYFGPTAERLFHDINMGLNTMHKQVEAAHYGRTTSDFYIEDSRGSCNDFRTKFFRVHERTNRGVLELCRLMVTTVERLNATVPS